MKMIRTMHHPNWINHAHLDLNTHEKVNSRAKITKKNKPRFSKTLVLG